MSKFLTLLLTIGLAVGIANHAVIGTAEAQMRTLPPGTRLAKVGQPQTLPDVQLNGAVVRMTPGAVVYDQNNRTITPNALPPGAIVGFTTDSGGDITRIYILTQQEQTQVKK